MFVPIVTPGLPGVTPMALLRVVEKKVAPWMAASQEEIHHVGDMPRKNTRISLYR